MSGKKKIKSLFLYPSPENDSRWTKDLNAKQNKNTKEFEEAKEEMLGKTFLPLLHNPGVVEEKKMKF